MQLEWIAYPITQYTLTGVGLLSSLTLWAGAKAEIRNVRRTMKASLDQLQKGVTDVNASIEDVRRTQAALPEPTPPPAVIPAPAALPMPAMPVMQGINLTRRTQILRMKRRGETAQDIASTLQIPLGEVSLILKMEKLQTGSPEPAASFVRAAGGGL